MSGRSPSGAPAAPGGGSVPLVSVGIVTFNQREFLRECLESVLAQDHPRLEIVVGDDGSTDGTPEMLREYARAHPGVFVLCMAPRNQGITANTNAVLAACTGRYIAWMGGDDLMLPGKLSRQAAFMEAHPDHVICYHNLDVFDSDTGRTLRLFNRRPGEWLAGRRRFRPRTGGPEQLVRHGTFLGACSVMVRRAACPPEFDPRIPVASDWLFLIETATRGRIGYLPEVLGRYRRHESNVTRSSGSRGEELLTLDIVDAQYPQLRRASRGYRRAHFLRRGARLALAGDAGGAARALAAAVAWGLGRAAAPPPPPRPVALPRLSDPRGSLSFLQTGTHVPFDIGEVRWTAGAASEDALEAGAAGAASFLVPLAGAFRVRAGAAEVALDAPDRAVVVSGPARAASAAPGGVLLALSSAPRAGDAAGPPAFAALRGTDTRVEDCRVVTLRTRAAGGGREVAVVPGRDVPFDVRRIYYLYDVPAGAERGGHAHRDLQQLIVCVAGAFDLVLDDGRGRRTLRLDRPDTGVYIPRLLWRELLNFAPGTVCMVLASQPYDESDYIREYPEFIACRQA